MNERTSASHLQVHYSNLTNPPKPPAKERDFVVVLQSQMHCSSVTVALPTECMIDLKSPGIALARVLLRLFLGQHSPQPTYMIAPLSTLS